MNLLLLEPADLVDGRYRVDAERSVHIRKVLKLRVGERLRVAVAGQGKGSARVAEDREGLIHLDEVRVEEAASQSGLRVVLALPRPKALKRCVQTAASFGIDELHLINAWRVDKSYWGSPLVSPERIRDELRLGCEQGCQSVMPRLQLHRYFKGFVEGLGAADCPRYLAHPGEHPWLNQAHGTSASAGCVIAIGPEGGWIQAELDSLVGAGFEKVRVSTAVLRSEIALAAALALAQSVRPGSKS